MGISLRQSVTMPGLEQTNKTSCEICQKLLCNKSAKNHLERHVQDDEFKCTLCDKIVYHRSDLKNHTRMHSRQQFKCDVCDKIFFLKSTLEGHKKMHSKKLSFRCKICPFASKWKITRYHMLQHAGENFSIATFVKNCFATRDT